MNMPMIKSNRFLSVFSLKKIFFSHVENFSSITHILTSFYDILMLESCSAVVIISEIQLSRF